MAEKTTQTATEPSAAPPAATSTPEVPVPRRTVTLPALPLAIVGAILVALIFFGGGIAVGVAIGDHHGRVGIIQPFTGRTGPFGGQNGFGQNGFGQNGGRDDRQPGQNGGLKGGQGGRPTPAPTQG